MSIVACPACGTKNRVRADPNARPRCARCTAALPWLVAAGAATFAAETAAAVPVVVDLWAPWCGPCHMIAPVLEELAREHAGRVKIVKVNVDEEPEISARYGVTGIPTLLVLRDGREVDRIVGAAPKQQLLARLQPHLTAV